MIKIKATNKFIKALFNEVNIVIKSEKTFYKTSKYEPKKMKKDFKKRIRVIFVVVNLMKTIEMGMKMT